MIDFKNFNTLELHSSEDLKSRLRSFVGESNYEWLELQHEKLLSDTLDSIHNDGIWGKLNDIEKLLNRDVSIDNYVKEYQSTRDVQNVNENAFKLNIEQHIARVEKDIQTDIRMCNMAIKTQEIEVKQLKYRFEKLLKALNDDEEEEKKEVKVEKPKTKEKFSFFGWVGDLFSLCFFLAFAFFVIIIIAAALQN